MTIALGWFADATNTLAGSSAPPPPSPFHGRRRELRALGSALQAQDRVVLTVAEGAGPGVGLSALAWQAAHQAEGFDGGLLAWSVEHHGPWLPRVLHRWASELGADAPEAPGRPAQRDAVAAAVAARVAEARPVLVVVDGVDRALWPAVEALLGSLPEGVTALVVTHDRGVAGSVGGTRVEVGGMGVVEGLGLLRQLTDVRLPQNDAVAVVEAFGGSPLGLSLAAHRLVAHAPIAASDLAALPEALSFEAGTAERLQGPDALTHAFYALYRGLSEPAQQALRWASVVRSPELMARHLAGVLLTRGEDVERMLGEAERVGLLQPTGDARWRMHPQVRAWAATLLEAADEADDAALRHADHFRTIVSELGRDEPGAQAALLRMTSDVLEAARAAIADDDDDAVLALTDGLVGAGALVVGGLHEEAGELAARAAAIARREGLPSAESLASLAESLGEGLDGPAGGDPATALGPMDAEALEALRADALIEASDASLEAEGALAQVLVWVEGGLEDAQGQQDRRVQSALAALMDIGRTAQTAADGIHDDLEGVVAAESAREVAEARRVIEAAAREVAASIARAEAAWGTLQDAIAEAEAEAALRDAIVGEARGEVDAALRALESARATVKVHREELGGAVEGPAGEVWRGVSEALARAMEQMRVVEERTGAVSSHTGAEAERALAEARRARHAVEAASTEAVDVAARAVSVSRMAAEAQDALEEAQQHTRRARESAGRFGRTRDRIREALSADPQDAEARVLLDQLDAWSTEVEAHLVVAAGATEAVRAAADDAGRRKALRGASQAAREIGTLAVEALGLVGDAEELGAVLDARRDAADLEALKRTAKEQTGELTSLAAGLQDRVRESRRAVGDRPEARLGKLRSALDAPERALSQEVERARKALDAVARADEAEVARARHGRAEEALQAVDEERANLEAALQTLTRALREHLAEALAVYRERAEAAQAQAGTALSEAQATRDEVARIVAGLGTAEAQALLDRADGALGRLGFARDRLGELAPTLDDHVDPQASETLVAEMERVATAATAAAAEVEAAAEDARGLWSTWADRKAEAEALAAGIGDRVATARQAAHEVAEALDALRSGWSTALEAAEDDEDGTAGAAEAARALQAAEAEQAAVLETLDRVEQGAADLPGSDRAADYLEALQAVIDPLDGAEDRLEALRDQRVAIRASLEEGAARAETLRELLGRLDGWHAQAQGVLDEAREAVARVHADLGVVQDDPAAADGVPEAVQDALSEARAGLADAETGVEGLAALQARWTEVSFQVASEAHLEAAQADADRAVSLVEDVAAVAEQAREAAQTARERAEQAEATRLATLRQEVGELQEAITEAVDGALRSWADHPHGDAAAPPPRSRDDAPEAVSRALEAWTRIHTATAGLSEPLQAVRSEQQRVLDASDPERLEDPQALEALRDTLLGLWDRATSGARALEAGLHERTEAAEAHATAAADWHAEALAARTARVDEAVVEMAQAWDATLEEAVEVARQDLPELDDEALQALDARWVALGAAWSSLPAAGIGLSRYLGSLSELPAPEVLDSRAAVDALDEALATLRDDTAEVGRALVDAVHEAVSGRVEAAAPVWEDALEVVAEAAFVRSERSQVGQTCAMALGTEAVLGPLAARDSALVALDEAGQRLREAAALGQDAQTLTALTEARSAVTEATEALAQARQAAVSAHDALEEALAEALGARIDALRQAARVAADEAAGALQHVRSLRDLAEDETRGLHEEPAVVEVLGTFGTLVADAEARAEALSATAAALVDDGDTPTPWAERELARDALARALWDLAEQVGLQLRAALRADAQLETLRIAASGAAAGQLEGARRAVAAVAEVAEEAEADAAERLSTLRSAAAPWAGEVPAVHRALGSVEQAAGALFSRTEVARRAVSVVARTASVRQALDVAERARQATEGLDGAAAHLEEAASALDEALEAARASLIAEARERTAAVLAEVEAAVEAEDDRMGTLRERLAPWTLPEIHAALDAHGERVLARRPPSSGAVEDDGETGPDLVRAAETAVREAEDATDRDAALAALDRARRAEDDLGRWRETLRSEVQALEDLCADRLPAQRERLHEEAALLVDEAEEAVVEAVLARADAEARASGVVDETVAERLEALVARSTRIEEHAQRARERLGQILEAESAQEAVARMEATLQAAGEAEEEAATVEPLGRALDEAVEAVQERRRAFEEAVSARQERLAEVQVRVDEAELTLEASRAEFDVETTDDIASRWTAVQRTLRDTVRTLADGVSVLEALDTAEGIVPPDDPRWERVDVALDAAASSATRLLDEVPDLLSEHITTTRATRALIEGRMQTRIETVRARQHLAAVRHAVARSRQAAAEQAVAREAWQEVAGLRDGLRERLDRLEALSTRSEASEEVEAVQAWAEEAREHGALVTRGVAALRRAAARAQEASLAARSEAREARRDRRAAIRRRAADALGVSLEGRRRVMAWQRAVDRWVEPWTEEAVQQAAAAARTELAGVREALEAVGQRAEAALSTAEVDFADQQATTAAEEAESTRARVEAVSVQVEAVAAAIREAHAARSAARDAIRRRRAEVEGASQKIDTLLGGATAAQRILLFEKGLAVARLQGDADTLLGWLIDTAELCLAAGRLDRAEALLEEARDKAAAPRQGARVRQWLARLSRAQGDDPAVLTHVEEGLALAREAGDREAEEALMADLGRARLQTGDLAGAEEAFREALDGAIAAGEARDTAVHRGDLSRLALMRGDVSAAAEQAQAALSAFGAVGDAAGVVAELGRASTLARRQGRAAEALRLAQRGFELAKQHGDVPGQRAHRVCRGHAELALGQVVRAGRTFEALLEEARADGDQAVASAAQAGRAATLRVAAKGRYTTSPADALAASKDLRRRLRRGGPSRLKARGPRALGAPAMERAAALWTASAVEASDPRTRGLRWLNLGAAQAEQGDVSSARATLARALVALESAGVPERAHVDALLAQLDAAEADARG